MSLPLHHIGYLTKDIAAAAAHMQARFGYVLESEVFEDPVQTARVQFLRQPGAHHWLELVAPLGADSKLSLAAKKKTTLHHLCYETADIAADIEALRGDGLVLLAEPAAAVAFEGRRVAWLADGDRALTELVEAGPGRLSLATLGPR